MVSHHCVVAFVPVHWANFTEEFEVLKCIDHAEAFIDGAAEWHVVDHLVANFTSLVDEEEATVSYELAFDRDIIVFVDKDFTSENVVVL